MVPEQVLRSVVDSLDAGLCLVAGDGTITGTNRVWDELLGTANGPGSFFELGQQGPADLSGLLRAAAASVRDVIAGHDPPPGQVHRMLVRGDERWWTVRVDQVRKPAADEVVVTLADVTRQIRAQEDLRRMVRDASRLALVARHMDDAVFIADAGGSIEWINEAFTRMTGFSAAEVTGRTWNSLREDSQSLQALSGDTTMDGQAIQPEFQARTKEGRSYWSKIESHRLLDDEGIVRVVGVEHDVTLRRLADETLLAAIEHSEALAEEVATEKALLTGVISSIPHMTYWKDFAGRYHGHNAAFLAMRDLPPDADLTGRTEDELDSQDDLSGILVEIENHVLTSGEAVVDRHITYTRANGSSRSVLMSVLPQPDAAGHIGGLIGVGADVTRVSELERQLNQANRLEAIGQLAAGIAHEINTPIQFVSDNTRFVERSFAQMLSLLRVANQLCDEPTGDDADQRVTRLREALADLDVDFLVEEIPGALAESLEGLERVAQIVRAMKDFSHPGQGRHATDINRAIESTAQVARNEWKYHAELDLRLGADVGFVPCYEGELKQVILNLIVNATHAIEATAPRPEGAGLGHITISSVRSDDHVEISVSDDGTGMDDATQQRIFDPFFTTKAVGKGTGQGLSHAYASIVHKHGGAIRVESAPGAGTTFVVVLPTQADAAEAAS